MTNPTCVTADASPLTVDQLDGIACIHCSADHRPMIPAGHIVGHGQVFECSPVCSDAETAQPATACPPWCDPERLVAHHFPMDIEHVSQPRDLVSASLVEGEEFADVCGGIHQQPGQAARVTLSIHTYLGDAEIELTPEEALQAAYGLINKAMAARAASSI
ncbi:hypothetical protein AB0F17_66115 [Nonomuraea sp. NPDC026600]|uniref:DUF6907 domain-containing protein n=1 Tax=Nonomuraea sp. NPDC026600 TaxID=3155363 RepID=UPI0033C7BC2B